MKSRTWRTLMLLSLTLVLVSSAMDAQAARRSSLAGNQFIDDQDDMFAFPQLAAKYTNRVIFDMDSGGIAGTQGNGSVIFGEGLVWQFKTGRGGYQNATSWAYGGTDRSPAGIANPDFEWWDVGLAVELGDMPFGFNISWATNSIEFTPAAGTAVTNDESESMLSFQVGTTLGQLDLVAELGFGGYTDESPGITPAGRDDTSSFVFTLLGRGGFESAGIDWRYLAAFTSASNSYENTLIEDAGVTAFRGSFGPTWGTAGDWLVAAYMSFEYSKIEQPGDPAGGDNLLDSTTETSFPAYNMAMEYYITSWLPIRGGVVSRSFTRKEETGDASGNPQMLDYRFFQYNWTLGLGLDKGNWGLDLALNEADAHSGYLPFNGSVGSDPIAYMTAWLSW